MKVAIRYYTRGGNTKKLADAISEAIGVEAKTTAESLTEDADDCKAATAFAKKIVS